MQKDKISAIPVANEDGTLYGMLSAGDVANYDMSSVRNPNVGRIPVYNLLSVLEGKILNQGGEMRDEISGDVTIALPVSRENLMFSSRDSIVVCGRSAEDDPAGPWRSVWPASWSARRRWIRNCWPPRQTPASSPPPMTPTGRCGSSTTLCHQQHLQEQGSGVLPSG